MSHHLRRVILNPALILILAACSGRPVLQSFDSTVPPLGDAGPQIPPDGTLEPDMTSIAAVEGLIYLSEIFDYESGAQQGSAFAFFTPAPMPFFTPTQQLGGGCAQYPNDEVGPQQFSAGPISISGGPHEVTLEPALPWQPDTWLYPAMLYPDLFSANTEIHVRASGDEVPGFSALAGGVGELKVDFPQGAVQRTTPLPILFDRIEGQVWVVLVGLKGDKQVQGSIRCVGSAETGQLTVPAAALAALPKTATDVYLGAGLSSETVARPTPSHTVHIIALHLVTTLRPLQQHHSDD